MYEKVTLEEYENNRSHDDDLFGAPSVSPGGAASQLGISRQAIHKAIKAGRLTAFWITDDAGNHLATLIPVPELERYQQARSRTG